jgi:microcystin-dependent protein
MPDATTPNYGWTLPTNNADDDTWGVLLNANWSALDAQLFRVSGLAAAAMPQAGGTFSGAVNGTTGGFSGTVTAAGFTGPLTGDVTGQLTGPVSGNATTASALQTPRTLSFTGDASGALSFDGSASPSAALALATVNADTGVFGSAGAVPVVTLDGKGRVTAASSAAILPGVPTGAVMAFAAAAAPAGWLECNGAAVSRAAYAALSALAAALGYGAPFGAGDGSTSFTLPDLRGQFVRGWADGGPVDPGRAFGSNQAAAVGAVTVFQTALANAGGAAAGYDSGGDNAVYTVPVTSPSSAGETRPVNVALMYCIKT